MKRNHVLVEFLVFIGFLFLFWGTSCQKSESVIFNDLPVVEAYLVPGEKIRVKISQKIPYDETLSGSTADISNLSIYIISGTTQYRLTPMGDGVYYDTLGVIPVVTDSSYSLHFEYIGSSITSSTLIPTKPQSVTQSVTFIKMKQFDPDNPTSGSMPDPVEITFSNPDNSYYLVTVQCMDSVLVPVIKDSIPSNDMLSSQPATGTEIDIQPMMIRYFGKNRIILYHINPEYATFFQRQASTSQNYQEPPTNITNGLGIFTGINSDTLFLNVIQQ
ncbi:MAG: DUF4249 family protein [Bacteroidales bacterium]|nr:DUF4249 domain-containing protein [Bacteroidales bacterium]MDD4602707.1 DUF4249 family protein [Bacteroidales bacterium]